MTRRGRERPGPGGRWLLLVPAACCGGPLLAAGPGRGRSPGLGRARAGAGCPAGPCHAGHPVAPAGRRGGAVAAGGPGSPGPGFPGRWPAL